MINNKNEVLASVEDGFRPGAKTVLEALESAISASNPLAIIRSKITINDGKTLIVCGNKYDLSEYSSVKFVSFGKAALNMALALDKAVNLDGGIIVTHADIQANDKAKFICKNIRFYQGKHPVPSEKSVVAAKAIFEFSQACKQGELLFILISGGGSAICCLPAAGLALFDKASITKDLNHAGATIRELNCVRKHLSGFKGGRLVEKFRGKASITLVLSDVEGNDLDVIASGPTVPDPTTYLDANNILIKYGLWEESNPCCKHIMKGLGGMFAETPKAKSPNNDIYILADNMTPVQAAIKELNKSGITDIAVEKLKGNAVDAGKNLRLLLENHSAVVAGGETTVKVTGCGVGGRNQELVLGSLLLNSAGKTKFVAASIGTDGVDGTSKFAGGLVTSNMICQKIKVRLALENNDSSAFLESNSLAIMTGPSGTNLNDVCIFLRIK